MPEKREFWRGDRVIVLSGANIPRYYGNWHAAKEKYVGCLFTIEEIYRNPRDGRLGFIFSEDEEHFMFDSRGVKKVERSDMPLAESYDKFMAEFV